MVFIGHFHKGKAPTGLVIGMARNVNLLNLAKGSHQFSKMLFIYVVDQVTDDHSGMLKSFLSFGASCRLFFRGLMFKLNLRLLFWLYFGHFVLFWGFGRGGFIVFSHSTILYYHNPL